MGTKLMPTETLPVWNETLNPPSHKQLAFKISLKDYTLSPRSICLIEDSGEL